DGRTEVTRRARSSPREVLGGIGDVKRALFALLHGREFVGRLRLPVAANALVFVALLAAGWLSLAPLFDAAFATRWWLLDALREHHRHSGSALWLCTTWLLLGPPLLDLVAGPFQEPLREATELRLLGPWQSAPPRAGMLRLRARAQLLALLLLAWPPALAIVLVPWLGLPLVLLLGGAVAAVVWFEPAMAPRRDNLQARLRLLWVQRWRCLGLGLALQLAAAVPFVNLLALAPVATIAATAAYLQFDKVAPFRRASG
ncbi:MAG: EI24 domain-containing protein, partial [Planctomycetota bacterium]